MSCAFIIVSFHTFSGNNNNMASARAVPESGETHMQNVRAVFAEA